MKPAQKSLAVAAVLGGLAAGAQAQSFYVGGGVLSGSGEWDNNSPTKLENDTQGSSLKLGYITSGGNRAELSYTKTDIDFSNAFVQDVRVTGFDIDFLWTFGEGQLKPYLGIGVGSYTFEDSAQFFTNNEDLKGFAFNLSAGLVYELIDNVELEAALRVKNIESEKYRGGSTTTTVNQTMTNLYLGANVKF